MSEPSRSSASPAPIESDGGAPAGHDHAGHDHAGHDRAGHDHAGHDHSGGHHDHAAHASRRALGIALAITASFLIVEAVAGILTGSLALLADAGHMLSDALALGASLFVAGIARRPRTARNTYGFRRAEVLAALFNAALLAFSVLEILHESVGRLADPPDVAGGSMLAVASAGLVANLVAAWILHRDGGDSMNVRGALLHVMGDALGSIAAIVAGVLLLAFGWRLADPIASLAISLLLIWGIWHLLREASVVLMESAPEGMDAGEVQRTIERIPGVASVHDVHLWSVVRGTPILTAHVVLEPGAHGTDVAHRVGVAVQKEHRIEHATIQPEAPDAPLVPLRRKPT